MSSCDGSEPDDCETVCETSISESYVHNRYYNDCSEFDEESATEYVSLGRLSFVEWERCEKKRLDMLIQANEKADQMEKTMKHYFECTDFWRKKWLIVRNERNSARNKIDHLMSNLQQVQNDTLKYYEAKVEAEQEIQRLKEQVQKLESKLNYDNCCENEDLSVQKIS